MYGVEIYNDYKLSSLFYIKGVLNFNWLLYKYRDIVLLPRDTSSICHRYLGQVRVQVRTEIMLTNFAFYCNLNKNIKGCLWNQRTPERTKLDLTEVNTALYFARLTRCTFLLRCAYFTVKKNWKVSKSKNKYC